MNRIVETIKKALKRGREKEWDRIYFMIDIHETILKPNYDGIATEFYPFAKECMQMMTARPDFVLIMWTCSKAEHLVHYQNFFLDERIVFPYVNRNPETEMNPDAHGDYSHKAYCNVLLDDKAGFKPDVDWEHLLDYLLSDIASNEKLQ